MSIFSRPGRTSLQAARWELADLSKTLGEGTQLETQPYSRQDSLVGDDVVRLTPFVHQPGIGLQPHPGAPLAQHPEDCYLTLPCLYHWGREKREVAQRLSWAPQGRGQVVPRHRSKNCSRHTVLHVRVSLHRMALYQLPVQVSSRTPHHSSCRPQEHKGARPGLHSCQPTDLPQPQCPSLGCSPQHSPLTWLSAQYIMSAACTNWYPDPVLHSSSSV